MRLTRSPTIFLSAILGLVMLGCAADSPAKTVCGPGPEPAPASVTPDLLLANLEHALNSRDSELYARLLSQHFTYVDADSGGTPHDRLWEVAAFDALTQVYRGLDARLTVVATSEGLDDTPLALRSSLDMVARTSPTDSTEITQDALIILVEENLVWTIHTWLALSEASAVHDSLMTSVTWGQMKEAALLGLSTQ